MIIGIDINEANVEKRVGVSEFAYELLWEIYRLKKENLEFQLYTKKKLRSDFPRKTAEWNYLIFGPSLMWTQFALPAYLFLKKIRPNVFFTPSHYAPRYAPCPTVISIMDVAYLHYPQLFARKDLYQLESWTKYSVTKASKILTISQSSKSDILKAYNVPPEKVAVIYPGVKEISMRDEHIEEPTDLNPHVYPFQELRNKFGIKGKFLLFVGTLQPRKNIIRLVEAFSMLSEAKQHELQLVIVGRKGWLYEDILVSPEKFGVANDVLFLDFVNNRELELLYQHALCFVFPSLYEGFGLPILEAMKHGCPVITSNVSSMPEAGGDAALYIDPLDVKSIKQAILKVTEDAEIRREMVKKGKLQIKKFSWEKAARETITILEHVASS